VRSVKASPQTQLRLLQLADLDADLARLDHRRRGLREVAELARLEGRASELKDDLVVTETELGDLAREQSRAERDVEQVRTRIEKDRARLDAGQVSAARELASLQSEIENLHRRQGDLEEIVLDLMERRETLESRQAELTTEQDSLGGEMAEVAARRDAAFKEIDEQAAKESDQRASVAAEVPAELLALYDQIRKTKGVGAAMLRAGRCEGCHLSLNAADLNVIRASPPDDVVRCEECRRILVRTPESGL
jgi:predicted  nucleic acid-binding Zn-ribbon protein